MTSVYDWYLQDQPNRTRHTKAQMDIIGDPPSGFSFQCQQCGRFIDQSIAETVTASTGKGRWHIRGRRAVHAYVQSLSEETHEWLLALYVDEVLNLLAVETLGKGGVSDVQIRVGHIIRRGVQLKAAGFVLVHNHPSGNSEPSIDDIRTTRKLAGICRDIDMPLIDHLIIVGDSLSSVGNF